MHTTTVKGKDKGTIVFIHGNSSSSKVYNNILASKTIAQTMVAVDLPGHGSSLNGYNKEEDFFISTYIENLTGLTNDFDDDILLVGNSLGGHIAIELVPHINRLKGLVIFGTPPLKKPLNIEEGFLPTPALQTFFTEHPSESEITSAATTALFDKIHVPMIVEDFKLSNPKVRKALVADVGANRFSDEFQIFTSLAVPKYIIAGADDPSVNPEYLNNVVEASGGNCKLIVFKDCGHYPSLEKPLEFNEILTQITSEVFK